METVHRLSAPARVQGSGVWRPASQTDYMYEEGEWMELGTTCFTYDAAGNPLVELTQDIDDMRFKIERTFDSYGYVTSMLQTLDEGGRLGKRRETHIRLRPGGPQLLHRAHGL